MIDFSGTDYNICCSTCAGSTICRQTANYFSSYISGKIPHSTNIYSLTIDSSGINTRTYLFGPNGDLISLEELVTNSSYMILIYTSLGSSCGNYWYNCGDSESVAKYNFYVVKNI